VSRTIITQVTHVSEEAGVGGVVPATRPDCDAGFIIMEPTEYPPMSGSNTMCIATVLLETGVIPMVEPETRFRLAMPAGPVDIVAECCNGKCVSVTLKNVPAFAFALDAPLEVAGLSASITIDIAYGGSCTGGKKSDMDMYARTRWVEYSKAKDEMFAHTDIKQAPWWDVTADDKRLSCAFDIVRR